jgi:hypothetical protein
MDDRGRIDPMLAVYFVLEDVAEFERFLMEHITKVSGIATVKSSFTLKK